MGLNVRITSRHGLSTADTDLNVIILSKNGLSTGKHRYTYENTIKRWTKKKGSHGSKCEKHQEASLVQMATNQI